MCQHTDTVIMNSRAISDWFFMGTLLSHVDPLDLHNHSIGHSIAFMPMWAAIELRTDFAITTNKSLNTTAIWPILGRAEGDIYRAYIVVGEVGWNHECRFG